MTPTSFVHRFARSKVGPPVFFTLIAILAWITLLDFRHKFSSPDISGSDFNFIAIVVLVLWGLVTRRFSYWTRWVVPFIPFIVCLWLSEQATRQLRLSIVRGDQGLRAILWFAGFFVFSLLWIVLIPVEEATYRTDAVPRGQLRAWPLAFAVGGLAMIASAGLIFVRHLESFLQRLAVHDLVAARNIAIYLSIAFCGLAVARVLLPIIRWRAIGIPTELGQRAEGPDI